MTDVYLGYSRVRSAGDRSTGSLFEFDGEWYYCISDYDTLPPFFMSVVSGWDHWMFVSSTGGLTCGRREPDNALFPYTTDDKIHDACATTGPITCLRVSKRKRTFLWEPFAQGPTVYRLQRNLYKSQLGNKLIFEEINHDLGLSFSYLWASGECLGFIRKARLVNTSDGEVHLELLDGLRNLLPFGVERALQANMSTLVDAYKQAEAVEGIAAGIYSLSSILTDRAEPSEALKCTVAWSLGLDRPQVLLSEDQLRAFYAGEPVQAEQFKKGKRGAFLLCDTLKLPPGGERTWYIGADVEQGAAAMAGLLTGIRRTISAESIAQDIESGTRRLRKLLGLADAYQISSDALATGRHLSNTLCNIMRGGVFTNAYQLPVADFLRFVGSWHAPLRSAFRKILPAGVEHISLPEALALARAAGDADMERLVMEYLPLTFSRRHGDPSRPWNHFNIHLRHSDGSDYFDYQGNWRDIFQNWEALALSYPEFIESCITKFVNASTPDGYNAYRIGRDGIDWEVFDAEDPWSNIGYWGDHQVGYLYRLLDLSRRYHPDALRALLERQIFVYADVPYRIKPYAAQLADPRNTVEYDRSAEARVSSRVDVLGSDGKLVTLGDGSILKVNLVEKLLVPALAKIGNLVPGGGIWMNTQRPEWNDANNALVGYGLSMVTLYYLRRYLSLFRELLPEDGAKTYRISRELAIYYQGLSELLAGEADQLAEPASDVWRKRFLDAAGALAETWRAAVYAGFSGNTSTIEVAELDAFLVLVIRYLDHSIALNRREDGLYHAYNLAHFEPDGYAVEPLEEMLEGQVAVLASGYLDDRECLDLLKNLRASQLYREDQNSYMLYPDRKLPLFREKNRIPEGLAKNFEWLEKELDSGRTDFVERDVEGSLHFNGRFRNVGILRAALERDGAVSVADRDRLCDIYEAVFRHRQFKGRSGSMYKYEGLGCIYWHMVSKLALAAGEIVTAAARERADQSLILQLAKRYEDIREGIGVHKTPAEYGAFSTDPYSHTPGFAGVQQPGLTGQVKEDFIARFQELGMVVEEGEVSFAPILLGAADFLTEETSWEFMLDGSEQSELLSPGTLGFCICGVPVIYRLADRNRVTVTNAAGETECLAGSGLGPKYSQALFQRTGEIKKIVVDLPASMVR